MSFVITEEKLKMEDDWGTLTPEQQRLTLSEYHNTKCLIECARLLGEIDDALEAEYLKELELIMGHPDAYLGCIALSAHLSDRVAAQFN